MAEITIARSLDRDPAAVWALLANFDDTHWIPIAENVTFEGHGIGMRRLLHSGDGEPIIEQLDAIDHDRRVLAYSIENNPLPTSEYRVVCAVRSDGNGTQIEWAVTFVALADEAEITGMIEAAYEMMAGWIAAATAPD